MKTAIVTVCLAEDIFCHMTCECLQVDENNTSMSVKSYYTVEESQYENFAKMMMLMKNHENEIINTIFKESEGKDELVFIIRGLLISYYREIQPQD